MRWPLVFLIVLSFFVAPVMVQASGAIAEKASAISLITTTFPFSVATPSNSSEATPSVGVPPESFIRYVSGDLLTFMRSNPAWTWAWFQAHQDSLSQNFSELASHQGLVGGDIKPDNVDIMSLNSGGFAIGLVDLDDGGTGSLLGDIFHTLVYNQVWQPQLPLEEALEWYEQGLINQNGKIIPPLSPINYEDRVQKFEHKLKKSSVSEPHFFSEFKLQSLSEASPADQDLFARSRDVFENHLRQRGQILFVGLRLKDSGGSLGVPRFTYLLKTPQGFEVYEFKLQGAPAVAAHGNLQDSTDMRLQQLLQAYLPADRKDSGPFVVISSSAVFLGRAKAVPRIDGEKLSTKPEDISASLDYLKHQFYWLGQQHRKQNELYANQWARYVSPLGRELKSLVLEHLKVSEQLRRQRPSDLTQGAGQF